MNIQETTEIRELTATELDHASGGQTFAEFLYDFHLNFKTAVILCNCDLPYEWP